STNSTCRVVCLPRPKLKDTSSVDISKEAFKAFNKDDFPTPDCPATTETLCEKYFFSLDTSSFVFVDISSTSYQICSYTCLMSYIFSLFFSDNKSIFVIKIIGLISFDSIETRKRSSSI